jgi:general secretion pathway protein D
VAALVAGCAYNQTYIEGRAMVEAGNVEEGLAQIEQAMRDDPRNPEIRNYYLRQRAVAVQRFLTAGDNARASGALDQAEGAYQRAARLDPDNERAKSGLEAVAKDRKGAALMAEANEAMARGDTPGAVAKAKEVLAQNPTHREARALLRKADERTIKAERETAKLSAELKKPITLEFRDAPLRQVFDLIQQRTGLNFIYDRDVPRDARATINVRNTSIEEVIRFVLVTNQLDRKVLNENTILIYPNTPAKAREYKDLVVRSFYLANADVKQTANMVRSLVKTRDLFVDEKLNLLVIRDTPQAVRIVEKLIANQDLSEPEVMLEVEVLEVGYNQLQQLGILWPSQVGIGITGAGNVPGQITGREASHFNGGLVRLTVSDPLIQFNARRQDGRTNVLANPRIRVKSREKARIHIGDRVPVITTTAGATGFVSESVNYLDVGLKLEAEPQVYLEDEVGIKLSLEVSNIAQQIKSSSGTLAYQVGTRNTATTLRLHDGETQVLAGLINDEDRRTANRVPGLSDLPVLGRIFSNNDDVANKTEIVLLVTPRILRNVNQPEARLQEFNSGTEAEVGGAPLGLPGIPAAGIPGAGIPGAVAPTQVTPYPSAVPTPGQAPTTPGQPATPSPPGQAPAPPGPTLSPPTPFSGTPPAAGPPPKPPTQ